MALAETKAADTGAAVKGEAVAVARVVAGVRETRPRNLAELSPPHFQHPQRLGS